MMENDIGIFSVPYDDIDCFKELLIKFYETNNSSKIKAFFKEKCLLLNPEYVHKSQLEQADMARTLKRNNTQDNAMDGGNAEFSDEDFSGLEK